MKEMVGGCCVCSDDRGWTENPLVYCDGPGCTVAVHQACYGIVTVPIGNWYCRKCESADRNIKVKCELCPNKDGALKPTDNNAWAHVVCALYIPEVRFGNVTTMEPIILSQIPQDRYHKTCYLCEEGSRGSGRASVGACMSCNKAGCKIQFHVTCAQSRGLLCEEAGNYMDNVKYCGYCHHHYTKLVIKKKGVNVKVIPPYKPVTADSPEYSGFKDSDGMKATSKRKLSTSSAKSSSGRTSASSVASSAEKEETPAKTAVEDGAVAPVPEPSKSPAAPAEVRKRRKGESRTPPVTGLAADDSPRPITPHGASSSGVATPGASSSSSLPSAGQMAAAPAGSPSLGVSNQAGQPPGPSGSSPSGSHEPKRPLLQAVLKDNMRPNSIVVNVPLEVLPSGSQGNIGTPTSAASAPSIATSMSSSTTMLPQVDLTNTSSLLSGGSLSGSPHKRSRSQSSEKTEKPRRSSKRSTGGSSSSNKSLSGSSPTYTPNILSSNKNDAMAGHSSQSHHSGSLNHLDAGAGTSKSRRHSGSHGSVNHLPSHSATNHLPSHSGTNHAPTHSATNHVPSHSATNHISHTSTNHLSHQQPGGSASVQPPVVNMNHIQGPPPAPGSPVPQVKDEKTDVKLLSGVQAPHMLGNSLNPSSTMAQKMCDTLSQEMVAHSVFNADPTINNHLLGPQVPGRSSNTPGSSITTNNNAGSWGGGHSIPQSLEQLLERQWEQGSQFLMEQAQHFDIASLLTCLHQLRAENNTLEDQVTQLIQRRDHLLAVNARLAIPLVSPVTTTSSITCTNPQNGSSGSGGGGHPSSGHSQASPIVENGLPTSSSPQELANFRSSTIRSSHSPATNVYTANPMFQQQSQPQVVMRRDVIEMNQSGSSKGS
uniref:Protein AF-10 n=1 Tax=Lygus hesperus TaxID=30085 RepID=A0A0A9XMM7_LYGHE